MVGIVLPMNQPMKVVSWADCVISPNATSIVEPQAAPIALGTSEPQSIQIPQSRPLNSLGSAFNIRNAQPAIIPCRMLAGRYAIETGNGAEPDSELEISGNKPAAIPPHHPNQMEPMLWTACPGQNAETNPSPTLVKYPTQDLTTHHCRRIQHFVTDFL